MKKIMNIIFALMVLIVCAAGATALLMGGPSELTVDILRYEPSPVEPGSYFEVWIGVQNEGTQAQDIQIEFVHEYPFSLAPGEND